MTALLWATFSPATPTHAAEPTATWSGSSLLYDNHPYYEQATAKKNESHGLAAGTHYYTYLEEVSTNPTVYKAHVIYFSPGTDPPTAKKATYIEYDYSTTKVYSHPTGKKSIGITAASDTSSYSSCAVQGVGWFICPIAVFMADSMDNLFKLVAGFFEVQPVTVGDTHTSLYVGWNVMRSVANVAFIIVFLIIIYSQLTSAGISNYGLKKLLPRLIIGAVLVNVSYFICSIAVDISNILGFSIQDIFVQIRKDTFNITDDTWSADTTTWSTVTAFVLSGGALGVIGVAVAGNLAGALPLLLPILVGVALTCLVVLIILAARQAIIVILIVIAPIAFVAYLLPNTEKWFTKWRELFMTMLIFFPAFSLIFGGSQLAGGLIIQSASSVIMIIFGLAVQIAPLVITPIILRLSGGLLGKIAGLVNNPSKGILDRSKNWANERSSVNRAKSLEITGRPNPFRKVAQMLDNSSRTTKKRAGIYETANENRYNRTARGAQIHALEHSKHLEKERVDNKLNAHTQHAMNTRGTGLNIQAIQTEQSKVELEEATETTNAMYSEYRAGGYKTGGNERLTQLQAAMAAQVIQTSIQKQRNQSAQGIQIQRFAEELRTNVNMQVKAGGIDIKGGAQRALAVAIAAQEKARNDAVANAGSILSSFKYNDDTVTDIALNNVGHLNLGFTVTDEIRQAATAKISGGANAKAIMKLVENIDIENEDPNILQTFSDTLIKNSAKPKFVGAGFLADAKENKVEFAPGHSRLHNMIVKTVDANKLGSAETLVTQDPDYLDVVAEAMSDATYRHAMNADKRFEMRKSIAVAKKDPQYAGRIGESMDAIDAIDKWLSIETREPTDEELNLS